jgi:hypothetical protein
MANFRKSIIMPRNRIEVNLRKGLTPCEGVLGNLVKIRQTIDKNTT